MIESLIRKIVSILPNKILTILAFILYGFSTSTLYHFEQNILLHIERLKQQCDLLSPQDIKLFLDSLTSKHKTYFKWNIFFLSLILLLVIFTLL